MSNPEKIKFGPEQNPEDIEQAAAERHDQLKEELAEKAGEKSHENTAETARHEALEQATKIEKHEKEPVGEPKRESSPAERRNRPTKDGREASFKATMNEVQGEMSAPSRAFSKVIHNKAVEKVSDVTATTIARPNAILSGAIFAFLLTLAVYLIAKNLGYPLSGFETIAAFILGWVIGIIYDFLKVMITGRK